MALAPALDANGDLDLVGGGPYIVGGAEAARGALLYRFGTQAGTGPEDPGEWRYDYEYGVLYRQVVLGRFFREDETQAHFAAVASKTTGVQIVAAYQVQLTVDTSTRTQFVVIDRLRTSNGDVVESVSIPVL